MRTYDADFRIEAVKLANEIGATKAAKHSYITLLFNGHTKKPHQLP